MTIDAKLDMIISMIAELKKPAMMPSLRLVAGSEVADDFDLDGQYGDEEIRKMPSAKYWQGRDFTGHKMSACAADFLDAYAKYKDACAYMNQKNGDPAKAKYIDYDHKSARRARGWAKRNEGEPKTVEPTLFSDESSDLPF